MDRTDAEVLSVLEAQLLHPVVVARAIDVALDELRPPVERAERRRAEITDEIRRVDVELARLTEALVTGGGQLQVIVAAIKDRESRRAGLTQELAGCEGHGRLTEFAAQRLRRDLCARLEDWRGLLRRQPVQARQILRKLVAGRLIFTPKIDEEGRFYEFTGHGTLGHVLAGSLNAKAMVTPAGFEPAISTLKGSRPRPG